MIVVGCPACGDNVLAPSGVSTEANVRCPLCMEEFLLSAFFTHLPPELIVLEQAVPVDIAPVDIAPVDIAPVEIGLGKSTLDAALTVEPDVPAFEFERGSAPVRPQVEVRQPTSAAKPKNVVYEMLKVVLGGVLGLAIGQILLWRMPGNWPAHQRDPFQFGEKYGNIFPVRFLAPLSVRDPDAITESEEGADYQGGQFDPEDADDALSGSSNPGDGAAGGSAVGADAPTTDVDPDTSTGDGADDVGVGVPDTLPGIRFAPRVTGSQLDLAVRRSESAARAWAGAEGARTNELSNVVSSLRELAHAVTFIQPTRSVPKATVKQLREFLPQFAIPEVRDVLYQGDEALDEDSALAGEVLVGEVTQIALNGELFQTTLHLPSGHNVPILSVDDPRERFTIGDQILILGVWVTDPSTQLSGYESLDGVVLFGEFPIRLVSANPDGRTQDSPTIDESSDETTGVDSTPKSRATKEPPTEAEPEKAPNPSVENNSDAPNTDAPKADSPAGTVPKKE